MWLLRQLTPDHTTIADFRKDHLPPIRHGCGAFTLLRKDLGLFGGALVAIDGSTFKAWHARKRNWNDAKFECAMR